MAHTPRGFHERLSLPVRLRGIRSSIGKTTLILPTVFAVAVGIGMGAFGLLFYVRDVFGAPPGLVAVFAAVWTASYSLSCIFLRPYSARLLPRYSLIVATSCMGLFMGLILLVDSLALAFLLYALYGVSISFFWPPVMGWLSADVENKELGRRISYFNLAWSTGNILGPFLGGVLFEAHPMLPPAAAAALFWTAAASVTGASLFLPRIREDTHREQIRPRRQRAVDNSTPLRFPSWVSLYATYLFLGVIGSVLPLHLRDNLGVSESNVGLMLLVRALVTTGVFSVLGRTHFWHFKRAWITGNHVALVGIIALFIAVAAPIGYAALLAVFAVIMGVAYNNSVFHGVSGSAHRAERMAIHESVLTAGVVSGSVLGGIVYQSFSITGTFVLCLSAAAAAFVPVVVLALRTPANSPEPPAPGESA